MDIREDEPLVSKMNIREDEPLVSTAKGGNNCSVMHALSHAHSPEQLRAKHLKA